MESHLSSHPSPLRITRIVLALAVLIGIGFSIRYNLELSRLRETHAELREQIGLLDVADPKKVAIAHVPLPDDAIPPGVEHAHVWRYRIHIPANYGPSYKIQRGLIKADSPQGRGGSGSSWSSPQKNSEEALASMALIKSDGRWIFCRSTGGGSSTSSMPNDFDFDSLDDLVIETAISPDDKTRMFETDEAICLIRLREKTLAKKRNGKNEEGLYRGFSVYLYSAKHRDAFEAWSEGETTSMQGTPMNGTPLQGATP